ncbi:GDSL esterase/lipase At1g29670 [Linum grandiflorum]
MNLQLQNHQNVISRILRILGSQEAADRLLQQCIYTVGIGSNDYLNNYFLPKFYTTSNMYTPDQYATVLIQQFSDQLMVLYNQGARKVALLGLDAVGCAPYAIETLGDEDKSPSPCVDSVNAAVQLFNDRLPALVDSLNLNFTGAHFTYIDNTNSLSIPNLIAEGFKVLNSSCCERVRGQLQCVRLGKVCPERTEYLYWDGVHPTQAVASFVAQSTYSTNNVTSPSTAHPYDIKTLALLSN